MENQAAIDLANSIQSSATLTAFDWTVIIVVGLSALLALFRGFIREVLSLATWVGAAILTLHLYDDVRGMLDPHIENNMIKMAVAAGGTYLFFLIIFSLISAYLIRFLKAGSDISMLDSIMGMLFGMARGMFIISLCYLILTTVMTEEEYPDWIRGARLLPHVQTTAKFIAKMAPDYVNEMSELSEKAKTRAEEIRDEEIKKQALEAMEKQGVSEEQRQKKLDDLLNSLEKEGATR